MNITSCRWHLFTFAGIIFLLVFRVFETSRIILFLLQIIITQLGYCLYCGSVCRLFEWCYLRCQLWGVCCVALAMVIRHEQLRQSGVHREYHEGWSLGQWVCESVISHTPMCSSLAFSRTHSSLSFFYFFPHEDWCWGRGCKHVMSRPLSSD